MDPFEENDSPEENVFPEENSTPKETAPRFFRCPVQSDHADATLCVAGARIPAKLQEQSIDGFTVSIKAAKAPKLRIGKRWVLETDNDRVEVHAEWMFHAPNGDVQVALRRMKDLNSVEDRPPGWQLFGIGGQSRRKGRGSGNEVAFAGVVVLIFAMLSLPGFGDAIGTAPRIQEAVGEIGQLVGKALRSLW